MIAVIIKKYFYLEKGRKKLLDFTKTKFFNVNFKILSENPHTHIFVYFKYKKGPLSLNRSRFFILRFRVFTYFTFRALILFFEILLWSMDGGPLKKFFSIFLWKNKELGGILKIPHFFFPQNLQKKQKVKNVHCSFTKTHEHDTNITF